MALFCFVLVTAGLSTIVWIVLTADPLHLHSRFVGRNCQPCPCCCRPNDQIWVMFIHSFRSIAMPIPLILTSSIVSIESIGLTNIDYCPRWFWLISWMNISSRSMSIRGWTTYLHSIDLSGTILYSWNIQQEGIFSVHELIFANCGHF